MAKQELTFGSRGSKVDLEIQIKAPEVQGGKTGYRLGSIDQGSCIDERGVGCHTN